jgi:hypothetical protein
MMGLHLLLWVHSERAGGGCALVGEHEPQDAVPGGLLGYLKCGSVPARAFGEADGPRPSCRLGEHQVGAAAQDGNRNSGAHAVRVPLAPMR